MITEGRAMYFVLEVILSALIIAITCTVAGYPAMYIAVDRLGLNA